MSGSFDLLWSPIHHSKFVTWGSDITLYEIGDLQEVEEKKHVKLSTTCGATVIGSLSGSGVRCVDISQMSNLPDPFLAVGYTTGKVLLTNLSLGTFPTSIGLSEYVPRSARICNSVSWCRSEPQLLAGAFDKHRSDHCISIWDVHRAPPIITESESSSESSRPIAEIGLSEVAHNVTWMPDSRVLVSAMNMKNIKIFDLRDLANKAVSTATSRHIVEVAVDMQWPTQLATRGESCVMLWDTRQLSKPTLTLNHHGTAKKLAFSPTRRNLVCVLLKDSFSLRLHSIQHDNEGRRSSQEMEDMQNGQSVGVGPSVQSRDVCASPNSASTPQSLCSFAWHCSQPGRLLVMANDGSVCERVVMERVSVSWGAGGSCVWGAGAVAYVCAGPNDIATLMRRRANTDYGLKPELWQNAELAEDEALGGLWDFVSLSRSLVEDGCVSGGGTGGARFPGVCSALGGAAYRSESSLGVCEGGRRVSLHRSAWRSAALQLCGWGWGWEQAEAGVERAKARPARAALLAALHLRLRPALEALSRSPRGELRLAAASAASALAAPGANDRLWRDLLRCAINAIHEPYLRALLHFLAATRPPPPHGDASHDYHSPHYDAILEENEIRLEDRVAFACIYLNDTRLKQYVHDTAEALTEQGDLSGILLTGMSSMGVNLLQRWLDRSGDVQSVALIAARCLSADDALPALWLDSYRSLLDSWKLWGSRCSLDTWAYSSSEHHLIGKQVQVSCSYCGKCVSGAPLAPRSRVRPLRISPAHMKLKQLSVCPHCRKPLPRCALCLGHVGSGAALAPPPPLGASFAGWLTWCLRCRHGGHAHHLDQWFQEHTHCPVSSCSCPCAALDAPDLDVILKDKPTQT